MCLQPAVTWRSWQTFSWAQNNLYDIVPKVRQRIIDSFTPEAHNVFIHEFNFFDKVTSISGVLYPLPKDERRAGIRRYVSFLWLKSLPFCFAVPSSASLEYLQQSFYLRTTGIDLNFVSPYRELKKIKVESEDLYLPTAPNKLVRGIQLDSGIPLQSAAKVPIMITFDVIEKDGAPNDIKQQACIFKVCVVLVWSSGAEFTIYFTF